MPENLDLYYSIASDISNLFDESAVGVCLFLLCRNFTKEKYSSLLAGAMYFLACVTFYYIPYVMTGFTAHNGAILLGFIVFALFDRENIRLKVFLFITFCVIRWAVYSCTVRVCSLFLIIAQRIMSNFFLLDDPTKWKILYAEMLVFWTVDFALGAVSMYLVVRELGRRLSYRHEDMEWREILFMLIPSVNGLIVYGIQTIYLNAYERDMNISFENRYPYMDILQVLCYSATLATILVTVAICQNMRKRRDEESAHLMLESRVQEMQSHIAEVEKLYTDIRGVKHDIKNHVAVIESLLDQGKGLEAKEYAIRLSETADAYDFPIKTGNPVTDVIIHEKAAKATELGIEFFSDFHYPTDSDINAFDISVILSNAVSNAMEAATAGGFIKLSSFKNKNAYLITVENSFDGRLDIGENGFPVTKKSDKNHHGYGLQNIRQVAAKYHGDVMISQQEDKVTLTIMLTV